MTDSNRSHDKTNRIVMKIEQRPSDFIEEKFECSQRNWQMGESKGMNGLRMMKTIGKKKKNHHRYFLSIHPHFVAFSAALWSCRKKFPVFFVKTKRGYEKPPHFLSKTDTLKFRLYFVDKVLLEPAGLLRSLRITPISLYSSSSSISVSQLP